MKTSTLGMIMTMASRPALVLPLMLTTTTDTTMDTTMDKTTTTTTRPR